MKEETDVWLSAAQRILDHVPVLRLAAVDFPGGLGPDGHLPQPRHQRLGQGRLDRPGDLPAADRHPGLRDRARRPLLRQERYVRERRISDRSATPGPAPRRRRLRPRAALRPARPRRDQRRGVRAGKGEDPAVSLPVGERLKLRAIERAEASYVASSAAFPRWTAASSAL